jgi:hypothetical protein
MVEDEVLRGDYGGWLLDTLGHPPSLRMRSVEEYMLCLASCCYTH